MLTEKAAREQYDVHFEMVSAEALAGLEPHLRGPLAGAMFMPDPVSVSDPEAVTKAYARLFEQRGGRFARGEAGTLQMTAQGWEVHAADGVVRAPAVVIALGPWSNILF